MEMNPDNPTTKAAHDHWHAIIAVVMIKLGITHININADDMAKVHALPELPTVMLHDHAGGLDLKLITQVEAAAILESQASGRAAS